MRKITLTDLDAVKFFALLTPDKVVVSYRGKTHAVYFDTPAHCVARVDLTGDKPVISVEVVN